MTDAERDSKLVLRAEAALAAATWREPEWDALAQRIESALAKSGPNDDGLLLPPLPESSEDGREGLAARAASEPFAGDEANAGQSQRGGASLADLARAAVARRSSKDAVNLAKESLAIASQGRTLAEPAPPPIVAASAVEREHRAVPPSGRQRTALDTRGPWIGVAIATVGLAAGFGLYMASRHTPEPIAQAPIAAVTAPTTAAAIATTAATAAPVPATPVAEAAPVEPKVSDEPKQAEAAPSPVPAGALSRESVALKSATAAEPRVSGAASSAHARARKVVLQDEASADATNAPAKLAPSGPMRPAELNAANGVSDRPSTGAAQAAVGAVLGAARSCLAGEPQPSSATLVFGSNGEVTSVNVSGPAAGTPAAACIKAALGKARVQPFAASSFSLGVTVRPL